MKRQKRALVLFILLAMLVSGCITIRMETKIKKDGSGTKSFVLALDKSVISAVESMAQESGGGTDDIWEAARAGADSIEGAKVEEFSDEDAEGIKITIPFGNFEELQALSSRDAFEGADSVDVSQDGDITTLKATVSVGELASGFDAAGGQSIEGFDVGEIDIEYTYAVEVEGEILEYSPKDIAAVKDRGVTWDLTKSDADSLELMVKWEAGGGPDMLVVLLIAVVLGGLFLAAVGIVLAVRSRPSISSSKSPSSCTRLYFGRGGRLLETHRKLKPAGAARLIWGEGDGSTPGYPSMSGTRPRYGWHAASCHNSPFASLHWTDYNTSREHDSDLVAGIKNIGKSNWVNRRDDERRQDNSPRSAGRGSQI